MRCKNCGGESSWLLYPALFRCSRCGSVIPYKRSKKKALLWAALSSSGWLAAAFLLARGNGGALFWLFLAVAFLLGALLRRVLLK